MHAPVSCFQKIGNNYVKLYKYELLRHVDKEDAAAWLVLWAVPVGKLSTALRHGGNLDIQHADFAPVYEAGICSSCLFY